MLHIVLLILKIIGVILAVILGIIVLLFCVILFVPLRYQIEAACQGKIESAYVKIRFSWLLHLFSGHALYQEGLFSWNFRAAFVRFPKEKPDKKEFERKEIKREDAPKKEEAPKKEVQEQKVVRKGTQEYHQPEEEKKHTSKQKYNKPKKRKSIWQKIKYTFQKICDKIKLLLHYKEQVTEFFGDSIHQSAFSRIKKESLLLLRFLKPKRLRADIHYGFEDPYYTGKVLAVLAMLYPVYGESLSIYPDFEKKRLEGSVSVKGKISGIYAVIIAWHLFFDKNIRETYKHIKAFKLSNIKEDVA